MSEASSLLLAKLRNVNIPQFFHNNDLKKTNYKESQFRQVTSYKDISKMTGGLLSVNDDGIQITIPKPTDKTYEIMTIAGNAIRLVGTFFAAAGGVLSLVAVPFTIASDSLIPNVIALTIYLAGTAQICIGEDLVKIKENLHDFHKESHSMINVRGTSVPTQDAFKKAFQGTSFRPLYTLGIRTITGDLKHFSVKLQGHL